MAAGSGTQESDCTWSEFTVGFQTIQTCMNFNFLSIILNLEKYAFSDTVAIDTQSSNSSSIYISKTILKTPITLAEPCAAGQYLDQSTGCQDCSADHWSAVGNTESSCTACPPGKGVAAGSGTQESDCTWSEFAVGFQTIQKCMNFHFLSILLSLDQLGCQH